MKVKPHLILREKGLNPDLKLIGGDFKGSLLDLLNQFYYEKVLGFKVGCIAVCVEEDLLDDRIGISKENRWNIGDFIEVERIDYLPYGIFLVNKEEQTLSIGRAEVVKNI